MKIKPLATHSPGEVMIVQDVQARYPSAMVPVEGFDAFHELIYLDELAAVGPGGGGTWREPPPHCLGLCWDHGCVIFF